MKNLTIGAALVAWTAPLFAQSLPPVPVPTQNPITPQKAVLGKALFWDEQLSSSDTVACGTCHLPRQGGADPRSARHPGFDGRPFTADDVLGSPGVVHEDASARFAPDPVFGLDPQGTNRTAPSAISSQYARQQFWDGRAGDTFVDPVGGGVVIPAGGSLESQALHPILNPTEMSREGRGWNDVVAKLGAARPLALATNLPADLAQALQGDPDYPELFRRAFGDPAITPVRIAFALATYERTLVPDQTPFDLFVAGNRGALTPQQQQGLGAFRQSRCDACHTPPFFTDHSFRNLGLRPVAEDRGRQDVTGSFGDRGRFKVPSLRNVGLRTRFMHTGALPDLNQVFAFYDGRLPIFPDNRDPVLAQVRVPPPVAPALRDFLENGLTDPRVRAGLPPFDRPTLRSERAPNVRIGAATAGTGGIAPRLLDRQPAFVGAVDFKIGVQDGLGGALALWAVSAAARSYGPQWPVHVDLDAGRTFAARLSGVGAGGGYTTLPLAVPNEPSLAGAQVFVQAFVVDPGAAGVLGLSATSATRFVVE